MGPLDGPKCRSVIRPLESWKSRYVILCPTRLVSGFQSHSCCHQVCCLRGGPSCLQRHSDLNLQVRAFLHIPADADMILERYSDSAGAYILLEPGNSAVYKQLYRAAKAKSKLKLRVALKPQEEAIVPKPVSIEDVQEDFTTSSGSSSTQSNAQVSSTKIPGPPIPTPVCTMPMPRQPSPTVFKTYESSFLAEAAKLAESADLRREFHARVACLGANLAKQNKEAPAESQESVDEQLSVPPIECPRYAICCNSCEQTTPDVHYHCSTCDDGDFDLCQDCVDKGITCYGSDHWLIKRTNIDGQIVTSTTETIAPKTKPNFEPKNEESLPNLPSFDAAAALAHLQENLAKLEVSDAAQRHYACMRTCNSCIRGKFLDRCRVLVVGY